MLHVRFSSAPAAQVVEAFKVITQLVPNSPGDGRGHGTFVAGIAAGNGPNCAGAAPAAKLVRERPGETEVVVHVPAPGGRPQPMPLPRRVAYDVDLLAEVKRRLGEALVQLSVAPPA